MPIPLWCTANLPNNVRAVMLAAELIAEHGLEGWTVVVNSATTARAGQCSWTKKEIELSQWLLDRAPWGEVEDTVRHEIAHAIAGPQAGHGWEWKRACRKVGAVPEACYDDSLFVYAPASETPDKYIARCCGNEYKAKKLGRAMQEGRSLCRNCRSTLTWYYA